MRGRLARRGLGLSIVLAVIGLPLWATGCMERLFYLPTSRPTSPPPELGPTDTVWFESADGTRLHGWFVPARGVTSGAAAPTILHVHGNAGNVEGHIGFTDYLPDAGFNLFVFDYRGYGRSAGRARSRGPLIADTEAALDALLERPDVDARRIGMYGQSLGGSIGLNVMVKRSEIRAAVIESAFASWREMAANAIGGDPPNIVARGLAAILIKDSHRPDEAIGRVQRPILILHGDGDRIIPVSHGRRLAAASNGHATLIELPGGDHNTLRYTHPEVERLTVEFFRKHLTLDD